MLSRAGALVALLAVAPEVFASSVRDEVIVDRRQSTAQNPPAGRFSNLLGANVDAGDDWVFSGTALVTVEQTTASARQARLRDTGGVVTSFSLGADWDVTASTSIGARILVSPESTTRSAAPVAVERNGRAVTAGAPVEVAGSSRAIELVADYDSAGSSDLEWTLSAGTMLARDSTSQRVSGLQLADGTLLSPEQTRTACALPRSRCPQALLQGLDGNTADLGSARLSLIGVLTVARDSDLALSGEYYLYDGDPAGFGYFGLNASRREPEAIGTPIAPLHWLLRPEVAHRFGAFSLRLWAQIGRYAPGVGESTAGLGTRAQMHFGRSLRVWLSASAQNDVDSSGDDTWSETLSLGAAWRF